MQKPLTNPLVAFMFRRSLAGSARVSAMDPAEPRLISTYPNLWESAVRILGCWCCVGLIRISSGDLNKEYNRVV